MKYLIALLFIFKLCSSSFAISVIEDDEIEDSIRTIANPIFKAANLDSEKIKIYIIDDKEANAFVTPDQRLFIHTGLLLKFDDPESIAGVIAHETGHILASHTSRRSQNIEDQFKTATLGGVVSLATMIVAAPIAPFILLGTFNITTKNYFSYSRQYEMEADQIGMDLLKKAGYSSRGLLKVMTEFAAKEKGLNINAYYRTHPISSERISEIRYDVENNKINKTLPTNLVVSYKKAMIKLEAFLEKPEYILSKYSSKNNLSNYAKAIAYYKQGKIEHAIKNIDLLLKTQPNDKYLTELKAQILFSSGRIKEAIKYYIITSNLSPNSSSVKIALANSYIILADKKEDTKHNLVKARDLLKGLLLNDQVEKAILYHYLSIAYGKMGDEGEAFYYMAEKYFEQRNKLEMLIFARKAIKKLPIKSSEYLKCQDLLYRYDKKKDEE